jgi:hypothetical protein
MRNQRGTLLGDITTFRQVFCSEDDRTLIPGQEHELQRRLAMVLQRTLRRQAQEFLDRPFTQRRCRLYECTISDDERSLYDDVTEYLLQPSLYAFAGRQRRLLLIGFHRRMASSIPALAASLDNVAARLRRLGTGQPVTGDAIEVLRDLEEDRRWKNPARTRPSRSIVERSLSSWLVWMTLSLEHNPFRTMPKRTHSRMLSPAWRDRRLRVHLSAPNRRLA